jgi:hypothetical protein
MVEGDMRHTTCHEVCGEAHGCALTPREKFKRDMAIFGFSDMIHALFGIVYNNAQQVQGRSREKLITLEYLIVCLFKLIEVFQP